MLHCTHQVSQGRDIQDSIFDCDELTESKSEIVGRTDRNDNATVTVKTSNGTIEPVVTSNTSAKNSVTWADIVRNGKSVKGKQQSVVSSSFSRNNPVSKD